MGHFAASSSQGPLHPQMLLQQQQQQQQQQHLQQQGHINPDMGSHPSNTNRGMGSTQATPMNLQMNDHFFNNSNFPAVGSTQQPFQSPQQQQPPISMLVGGGTCSKVFLKRRVCSLLVSLPHQECRGLEC